MKVLRSSLVRALCAIIVGVLLIKYREQTVTWITIAIGVMFFMSGVLSCVTYMVARRQKNDARVYDAEGRQVSGYVPPFPIVGLGSMLLGLVLALMPATFVAWLMYILAAILMLGAIGQFFALASVSKIARVGFWFWLMPSLVFLVAVVAILRPSAIAAAPLFVIGWCMILYGVVECINTLKIYRLRKMVERSACQTVGEVNDITAEVEKLEP